jgi:hypothetical protein
MTDPAPSPAQARNRWLIINAVRLIAIAGAVFGAVLLGRFDYWSTKVLGAAIVLSALYMSWTIPAALAQRWASPGNVRTNRRRPPKLPK